MFEFQQHKHACVWAEPRPQPWASATSDVHFARLIKWSHLNCHYTGCFSFLKPQVQVTAAFESICGWAAGCQYSVTGAQSRTELVQQRVAWICKWVYSMAPWPNENCSTKLLYEYKRRFIKMIWFVNDTGWSPIVTLAQILALIDQRGGNVKCAKWSQEVAGRWLGSGESSASLWIQF